MLVRSPLSAAAFCRWWFADDPVPPPSPCPSPSPCAALSICRRVQRDAGARFPAALRVLRSIIYSGALIPAAQIKASAAFNCESPGLHAGLLTAVHAPFLIMCLSVRDFSFGVELAATPVVGVVAPSSPAAVDAASVQNYFYAAGCTLAGARLWSLASAALLKAAVGLPSHKLGGVTYVGLEAYKKWLLVAAIAAPLGASAPALPRSTRRTLVVSFAKPAKPYEAIAKEGVAVGGIQKLRALFTEHANVLHTDGNASLAKEVERAALARLLQKLAGTHERVGFGDVIRFANLPPDTHVPTLLRWAARAWTSAGLSVITDEATQSISFVEENVDSRESAARSAQAGLAKRVEQVARTIAAVRAADEGLAVPTRARGAR